MPTRPLNNPVSWQRHVSMLASAWLLSTAWGSVVQTRFNLQALVDLGVDIPLGLRALTTVQDLAAFAPIYGGILAAGWLPALSLAAWWGRRQPAWRMALMAVAAGLGMVAAVRAVDAVAPMPVFIDATRGLPGLLSMAFGSVLGGALYARWTR